MTTAYKWHPITDFDRDSKSLTDGELIALERVWLAQRIELTASGELEGFNRRLRREWAIETGIIENVYTLDLGTTRTLILKGIDASLIPHDASNRDPMLVARIIQDHYDTLEVMLDFVGDHRELSTGYVKELHAALLRNQETYPAADQFGRIFERPLAKGQYKTEPNSPTRPDGVLHEYCPPEHVAAEMDRLVEIHREHETRGLPVEVEAAWLHHRFTQIHPFADGNGRVARAIASLVFIKAGWFPLIIKREDRKRYLDALEQADQNDLHALVALFVEAQRNVLIQATEAAYDIRPASTEQEAIGALRDRFVHRGKLLPREWETTKRTAAHLVSVVQQRLALTAGRLQSELGNVSQRFTFAVSSGQGVHAGVAEKTGVLFDPTAYNTLVLLGLNAGRPDAMVFWFYGAGPRYRGIIGVVAYLYSESTEPIMLQGGTFQINYEEDLAAAQSRFSPWLERMIVEGLNEWRRRL